MGSKRALGIGALALVILVVLMANCSDEKCQVCAPRDTTPPAAVDDLSFGIPTSTSITFFWQSPGDDGDAGTAFRYDIRIANDTITEASWDSARQLPDVPAPKHAGSGEHYCAENLLENTRYFYALKTVDESGNWSGLSNVPSVTTLPAMGLLEIVTTRCMVFMLSIFIDDDYMGSYSNEHVNDQAIAIEVALGSHTLYAQANIVVADTSYCWTKDFTIVEGQRSAVLVLDCIGASCPTGAYRTSPKTGE
jgi:hypothetical protein